MRIQIKVKPRSKAAEVSEDKDGSYLVRVKKPAQEGKANKAVIEILAKHFGLPKRAISIVRGRQSRNKLIEISIREFKLPRGSPRRTYE